MAARTPDPDASISGHVWLYEGKRRKTWCAKWRDQNGQHEKRLGPAWTAKKGTPPSGFLRERDAQALLDALLVDARRGQLRPERTGFTFADVAEDWYERGRFERDWSASTQVDYRSVLDAHLLPEFKSQRIETITPQQIERWRSTLAEDDVRARRTVNKIVTQLNSVLEHAVEYHGLLVNPAAKASDCASPMMLRALTSIRPRRSTCWWPPRSQALIATPAVLRSATMCGWLRTSRTPRSISPRR
jgi:hypothetical protein